MIQNEWIPFLKWLFFWWMIIAGTGFVLFTGVFIIIVRRRDKRYRDMWDKWGDDHED